MNFIYLLFYKGEFLSRAGIYINKLKKGAMSVLKDKVIQWLEKNKKKKWLLFLDQLGFRFQEDDVSSTGSQLAYYLVLSIFPFLIFLLNMVKFTPLASEDVLNSLVTVLPLDTQEIIREIVTGIIKSSSRTLLSVSVLVALWTASSGISNLIKAINKSYDYKEGRSFIVLRFISVFFTLILALVIVLVFGLLIFGEIIGRDISSGINISSTFEVVWPILSIFIPLVALIITFTLLFMFGPAFPKGSRTNFKGALPGAIFVTLGWIISSTLFSFYVNNFGKYSVTYGSLGGVIVFLIWLYISSIIIMLGGEINATIEYFNINNWTYDGKRSLIKRFLKEKND